MGNNSQFKKLHKALSSKLVVIFGLGASSSNHRPEFEQQETLPPQTAQAAAAARQVSLQAQPEPEHLSRRARSQGQIQSSSQSQTAEVPETESALTALTAVNHIHSFAEQLTAYIETHRTSPRPNTNPFVISSRKIILA